MHGMDMSDSAREVGPRLRIATPSPTTVGGARRDPAAGHRDWAGASSFSYSRVFPDSRPLAVPTSLVLLAGSSSAASKRALDGLLPGSIFPATDVTTETETITETDIITDRFSAFDSSLFTLVETKTEVIIRSVSVVLSSVLVEQTASSTSAPPTASASLSSREAPVPVIVGSICGALVLVLVAMVLCVVRRRRSRLRHNGSLRPFMEESTSAAHRVSLVSARPVSADHPGDCYEPTLRTSNMAVGSLSPSSSPEPHSTKPMPDDMLPNHTLGSQFEEHGLPPDSLAHPAASAGPPARRTPVLPGAMAEGGISAPGATPLVLSTEGGRTVLYAPIELDTSETPIRLSSLLRRLGSGLAGIHNGGFSGGRDEVDSGMRIHNELESDVPPPPYTTE